MLLDLSDYIDCNVDEEDIIADMSDETIIDECYIRSTEDFMVSLLVKVLKIDENKAKEIIINYYSNK